MYVHVYVYAHTQVHVYAHTQVEVWFSYGNPLDSNKWFWFWVFWSF